MRRVLAGVALALSAEAACLPKLKLEVYMESGCSYCKSFVEKTLAETLSLPGVADIVDLDISAFGNCYYKTQQCGGTNVYDMNVRKCFNKVCGAGVVNKPADCFTGALTCQHGNAEAIGNRYLACAKKETNRGIWKFLPFATCLEKHENRHQYDEAMWTQAIAACSAHAGLSAASLTACQAGDEGKQLVIAEAGSTPPHDVAPMVLLNGKQINGDMLLQELCTTYTGTKPAGCTQR